MTDNLMPIGPVPSRPEICADRGRHYFDYPPRDHCTTCGEPRTLNIAMDDFLATQTPEEREKILAASTVPTLNQDSVPLITWIGKQ